MRPWPVGEPQTPIIRGLRLYQWFALASVAVGIAMTWFRTESGALPAARWDGTAIVWAVAVGLVHVFAMGVDFPRSNRRFSRLV